MAEEIYTSSVLDRQRWRDPKMQVVGTEGRECRANASFMVQQRGRLTGKEREA